MRSERRIFGSLSSFRTARIAIGTVAAVDDVYFVAVRHYTPICLFGSMGSKITTVYKKRQKRV